AAVDIGNSRAKALGPEGESFATDYSAGWERTASEFIHGLKPDAIGISSVSSIRYEQLLMALDLPPNYIYNATKLLDRTRFIKWKHIAGAGADRALGIAGAAAMFPPPLITIDCGTAITINLLAKDNIFAGGTIMPGLKTQISALANSTDQLREISIEHRDIPLGMNTDDAILAGVLFGAAGSVINIVERIERRITERPTRLVLTGGHARDMQFALRQWRNIDIIPDLVLRGLLRLLEEQITPSGN
ncbi:MAG: type III pantothenate kinase, partial [Bacteroidota bacterium]